VRRSRLILLFLLGLLAGCAHTSPPDVAVDAAVVSSLESGWEYRVVAPFGETLPTPPQPGAGGWRSADDLEDEDLAGARSLWLRRKLPGGPPGPAILLFRSYTPRLSIFLDREPIYRYRAPAAGDRSLSFHVVRLPPGYQGRLLLVAVAEPEVADVTGPVLVAPGSLSAELTAYLSAYVSEDLPDFSIALFLGAVGILAWAFTALRQSRSDGMLLGFGGFAFLYGLRLFVQSNVFLLLGAPLPVAAFGASFITYLINVPAWYLFLRLLGPGWKTSIRWAVRVLSGFAVVGMATDLATGTPGSLGTLNNVLVILAIVAAALTLWEERQQRSTEIRVLTLGFAVLALFAAHENLVGLGLLPWRWVRESIGFLFFVGCLGFLAARRFIRAERDLVALESELDTARQIQNSVLPQEHPPVPGLSLSVRYLPTSSVAGDFYDFLQPPEGGLTVLVADVSGHGVPAALIASMVKVAVSEQIGHASDPARVLKGMNATLCGKLTRAFVTAVCAHLDPASGVLRLAGAGHPHPFLMRSGDDSARPVGDNGLILGRFPEAEYSNITLDLLPGDRILLFTDGVIEARGSDEELFGERRLAQFLAGSPEWDPEETLDALLRVLVEFTGRGDLEHPSFTDDVTVLVVDYTPAPGDAP
jgi:sigma-B regulation protein RsbU (phosphoserine phosphatase)